MHKAIDILKIKIAEDILGLICPSRTSNSKTTLNDNIQKYLILHDGLLDEKMEMIENNYGCFQTSKMI